MNILIGLLVIIGFIALIYMLGIIPNLWSNKLIHCTNFEDIFNRGIIIAAIIISSIIMFFLFNQVGEIVRSFT